MYAIISDSGRQYRVEEGQEVEVDYREAAKGDKITFDNVLAISGEGGTKLGKPTVTGAAVIGEVIGAKLGKKLVVQKFRRRKNSRRKNGHRQVFTTIRVEKISS